METHCTNKMRKKNILVFVLVLVVSVDVVLGKTENKTKTKDAAYKKYDQSKNGISRRSPRSIFGINTSRNKISEIPQSFQIDTKRDTKNYADEKNPFWGSRGRRESESVENLSEVVYPDFGHACKNCNNHQQISEFSDFDFSKERNNELDVPFWGNRGRRSSEEYQGDHQNFISALDKDKDMFQGISGRREEDRGGFNSVKGKYISNKEGGPPSGDARARGEQSEPFWGSRGRRDDHLRSSDNRGKGKDSNPFWGSRGRREDSEPFWGNRGRREESEPFWGSRGRREESEPFWGSRGRRDVSEPPFWGSRGRREQSELFWGNRGRREESEPFWGSRGRREEPKSFWGSRGRREESEPFWGSRGRREEPEPLWGSRDRREEPEPFWGSRGRREKPEPFWGSRGRREESEPFWGNQDKSIKFEYAMLKRQQTQLKVYINKAIDTVKAELETISRLRRSNYLPLKFLSTSEGRDKIIKQLIYGPSNSFLANSLLGSSIGQGLKIKPSESKTILDDRNYAEEPKYIIVERSSRSSSEDDPFYISRGKKKLEETSRDRRGAFEELVKSVRNDPYYIARGKKDWKNESNDTDLTMKEDVAKTKELICASIDLLMSKNGRHITRREVPDTERDRRIILKKLAAQLQIDPYFATRGKRSDDFNTENEKIINFINEISSKCH